MKKSLMMFICLTLVVTLLASCIIQPAAPVVQTPAEVSTQQPASSATMDLSAIVNDFSSLDKKSLEKINELTEDSLILMLKSITVQAEFSESKKNRLALIKYLLLA